MKSKAALEATPKDHTNYVTVSTNLGLQLSHRYDRTGNLQDLEAAVAQSEAALEVTPEGHPGRATVLYNLGSYLTKRYERTGNPQDLVGDLAALSASWSITTAPILTRIKAVLIAAYMLVFIPSVQDLSRACSLLRDAIHLIPLATLRSLEREDQQHILETITGLVSLAASVSLEVRESPLEALRLLGLGRNITNGQLLDYRSDISDLIHHYPTLARDFHSLHQELDSPFPLSSLESSRSDTPMSMNQRLQLQQSATRRRKRLPTILIIYLYRFVNSQDSRNFCGQNPKRIYCQQPNKVQLYC